ncbi:cellulase family glycosylhydrolase [Actinosynnema mirum]|uniref:Cellulase n=1 Tax=Actinosynnema mirum (strain ATCC 29888 / DSM 43827 / JCM 3225 / NBRC 14064 / NCIMB 13271 / NRRL B-12336 / IMRU 3971 / 101) TaxID=446462 RepID=C6W9M3_ACTMD|nr:cellulase family glycosylhydrolase [Actinosynnema mirum]ACU37240.1 Cellulase [Actinosynnema mirum DSM 43827]
MNSHPRVTRWSTRLLAPALALLMAAGSLTATATASPAPAPAPASRDGVAPADARATVAAMQPGWNLGNTLDAIPDETSWGNPRTTRALLRHVREQGYRSVRLPITWSNHHGPAPDFTIDPAWLARVREVVDWSLAEGLHVMVNLHHDSWQWLNAYPTDRANVLARYTALWKQIATAFREHPSKLVFENINEPQFAGTSGDEEDYRALHELNAEFHRVVRGSGGGNTTRLLVLPTLHTSADQGRLDAFLASYDLLRDTNIAATTHFYGFWPFSVNIAGHTRFDAEVERDLVDTFDRVRRSLVDRGIPVIVGEWALLNHDHTRPGVIERGEFLKFLEAVGHHARTRGLTTMLWDAGQFLDRTALRWRDQGLHDLVESSWTTRSGTAASDRIHLARSQPITARSLALNLNGTALREVRSGGRTLARGSDYTVSGSTLTFSAAALTRLAGNRAHGVNATVELRFSQGVPWPVDVISSDRPVQSAAEGTTAAFAIPTRFLGDQLATMEAAYADGSPAGPANWTTYKEFWQHFQPDPAGNRIILKPEFFAEVADGVVALTFHFWSGERVAYRVTKAGDRVTGTP